MRDPVISSGHPRDQPVQVEDYSTCLQAQAHHPHAGRGGNPDDARGGGDRQPRAAEEGSARLKRDAPEIAAAVERGEYRSIRQAALAAG